MGVILDRSESQIGAERPLRAHLVGSASGEVRGHKVQGVYEGAGLPRPGRIPPPIGSVGDQGALFLILLLNTYISIHIE
jgi:hypothetical protein